MNTLSMSLDHKTIYTRVLTFIIVMGTVLASAVALSYYFLSSVVDVEKQLYFAVTNIVINGSMSLCLGCFLTFLYFFYIRFKLINQCIRNNFVTEAEDESGQVSKRKPSKIKKKIVMKLADMHDSLVDATSQLNYCFAFQTLNIVAGIFITNIFSTFAIYRVFVRQDFINFYRAVVQYAWNIFFLIIGLVTVAMASILTRTGKFTAVLVHKAINCIDDDDDPIIDYVSFD